jgi:hypothetical protein
VKTHCTAQHCTALQLNCTAIKLHCILLQGINENATEIFLKQQKQVMISSAMVLPSNVSTTQLHSAAQLTCS